MRTFDGKPSAVVHFQELKNLAGHIVLLDCRPLDDYRFCHIDGALQADVESMLSSATEPDHDPANGGRHPLPKKGAWEKRLQAWGVQPDSFVVAYDDAWGSEGAARLWWMLSASGVRAAVLDGGWGAAVRGGVEINCDLPTPLSSGIKFNDWLLPTVEMDAVDKARRDPEWMLFDVRSTERWRGEAEDIDPVAGRIQGSRNIFFKENLEGDFFKNPEGLRKLYLEALDLIPPECAMISCGSGITACHTLLALHQAGLSGASLYIGSFSEWCRNKTGSDIGRGIGENDLYAPNDES